MNTLNSKIDFALIFRVTKANPNGDPLNGNRPRTDYSGRGEVSDICLKRKLRDRLLERFVERKKLANGTEQGQAIFVQSDDRREDEFKNLRQRADSVLTPALLSNRTDAVRAACEAWFDVRAFGQVFAFKGTKAKKAKQKAGKKGKNAESVETPTPDEDSEEDSGGVSIPVRGPVTVQSAFSVERIDVESLQISKSTSLEGNGEERQSDQLGTKHRVDQAVYVSFGSMSPQLAERTGFSDVDADAIKAMLPKLFENDASSARPDGSMQVLNVIWWKHNCKAGQYSSARVHGSLTVKADGTYIRKDLDGLIAEELDGF